MSATAATCPACGTELTYRGPGLQKWCSERCRKSQYDRECVDCGGRADGTTPGRNPQRCAACDRAHRHESRYWTPEAVLAAVREHADANGGIPPTAGEAGRSSLQHMAQIEFGSWSAAVRAAGYEPHTDHPGRKATAAEMLATADRYAAGESAAELAVEFGITPRGVYRRVDAVARRGRGYYEGAP